MMVAYSIIIPVYNAEKYLESCVESVLSQRSAFGYEIIIVNDGSSDRSAQICDRYAEQTPAVKVIHQVNQGVSAARNAGIAAARGDYLLFLDGDDYLDPRLLPSLDRLIADRPDVIAYGYRIFCGDAVLEEDFPVAEVSGITGAAYFELHKENNRMPIASCWSAAFKRQFVEEQSIRFPVGVTYGEDFDFHMHCLKQAQSVFSLREPLYWYRVNEASATHTPSAKKLRDLLSSCAKMYRLFPCAMFADYYCGNILHIAKLNRKDAAILKDVLDENRDVLKAVGGVKERAACVLFRLAGWYNASRLLQWLIDVRHGKKG